MQTSPWAQLDPHAPPAIAWPLERCLRVDLFADVASNDAAPRLADAPAPRPNCRFQAHREKVDAGILALLDRGLTGPGEIAKAMGWKCNTTAKRNLERLLVEGRVEHPKYAVWLPKGARFPKQRPNPRRVDPRLARLREAMESCDANILYALGQGKSKTTELMAAASCTRPAFHGSMNRLRARGLVEQVRRWELVSPSPA